MKNILLAFLLTIGSAACAQITSDSIKGTWVNTDLLGKELKLVIAGDSVTFISSYPVVPGSSETQPLIYVVPYTIENGDSLRIDDAYYKVVRTKDGIQQIATEVIRKGEKVKVIYRRE